MANGYFLRIDGIDGDATQVGYEDAIDVITWSWGVSTATGSGAGGAGGARRGRPAFDELQVVARLSRASPELVESCVTGRHHANAVLTGVRLGGDQPFAFIRYELGDVTIASVEHSDAEDEAIEELAIAYRELSITHTAQRPDGAAGNQTSFSHP